MHHFPETVSPSAPSRLAVLSVVGWGALWAWLGTINGSFQVTHLLGSLEETSVLSCTVMGILVLWRILLALFSKRLDAHLNSAHLSGAAALAIALCTVGLLLGLRQGHALTEPLLLFECATCVLGLAWLSTAWVSILARLQDHSIFPFIAGGFLLASLINLSIEWLPSSATVLTTALFPLASALCLVRIARTTPAPDQSWKVLHEGLPGKKANHSRISPLYIACIALSIFCYGLAGAIIRILSRATSPIGEVAMLSASSSHTLGIALCAATLLAIALVRQNSERALLSSLSKIMLAVMAFGMLLPALFPSIPFFLADFVSGLAIGCFEIMLLTYAATITKQQAISPFATLGVAYGSMEAAGALSYPLTNFLENALSGGFAAQWSTIALIALFAFIIVSVGILIPFTDKYRIGTPTQATPDDQSALESQASESTTAPEKSALPPEPSAFEVLLHNHGLTEREIEVALLLSEGRNVPYVQEHLVISQGTAQTHTYHIYQKLGIHSKQELIELARNA